MRLQKPPAPFKKLNVIGDSITIDVDATNLVIPTGNQNTLPSFNEFTQNPNRAATAPCGGLKDSIVQDKFPGSLAIEGDGCYLQTTDGTYTGKTIGAGKLSETSSIIDSGSTGIAFATADGVEFRTGNGTPFLLSPPSSIVEKFKIINISNDPVVSTIYIKCPDSINSVELFNISHGFNEIITPIQTSKNEFSFSKILSSNASELLQLTVIYNTLVFTQTFSDDADTTIGLENMSESWIAWLPKTGTDIDFVHFTEKPRQLSYKQASDGTITQITIYPGNGSVYHGQITHPDHTRVSGSGYIPDVFNKNMHGSITKFLQAHGMRTDFPSDATITTWIVPAISDTKILPFSEISDDYLGDTILLRMCPGEYGCASFVVDTDKDLNIDISVSDLSNNETVILRDNVDVRIVKRWYQAGNALDAFQHGRFYTPELLLHDGSLIRVDGDSWNQPNVSNPNGKNYLNVNGSYIDISSDATIYTGSTIIPITDRPIKDTNSLQTVHLSPFYNTQFWITVCAPDNATAGNYTAVININNKTQLIKSISLSVQVLPLILLPPNIEYSIYYSGRIYGSGSISGRDKTVEQYTAEISNLCAHGVKNPVVYYYQSESSLIQQLSIRQSLGMDNSTLYYWTPSGNGTITAANLAYFQTLLAPYGVETIYLYGRDEQDMNNDTDRANIAAVHTAGGKMFVAQQSQSTAANVADVMDTVIIAFTPSKSFSATYHSNGHKVYSYYNPQSPPEYPLTFRRNYGLAIWQADYDGVMDFIYQYGFGDIWNDFDSSPYRDHCFTYPTLNGVIDTVQWEGFREAVTDMRYLATLQAAITAHPGDIATTANAWLMTLKSTDLLTVDLDSIRSQIIDYIIQLQAI